MPTLKYHPLILFFFFVLVLQTTTTPSFAKEQADSVLQKATKAPFPIVPFNYNLKFQDRENSINLWRHGVNDAVKLVSSPIRWDLKDWGIVAGITAGGALIYFMDEPLYESASYVQGNSTTNFSTYFLDPLGDYRFQAVALAGTYGASWILKDEKLKNATILTTEALLLTGAVTLFANFMTGRKTPLETNPVDHTQWMGINNSSSFWSGHAATTFTIATVLSGIYNENLWMPVTSYTLATLVSLSRVVEGHHWTSDVFVGAAIGTVIGRMVISNYRNKAVQFTPYYAGRFKGISARYTF